MFPRRAYLLGLLILCIYGYMIASLQNVHIALAAGDPITVTTRTDTLEFPKAIDFLVQAHDSAGALTQATLYIGYNSSSFQESHLISAASSTNSSAFRWHEDAASHHFTPVGTQITYYWLIADSTEHSYTDAVQTFQVTDSRFAWQHLTQGLYQVNWYARPTDFGRTLLTQVATNIQRISTTLGIQLQHTINIWAYTTTDDFQGALPPQAYEWTGGIAFPALNQTSIVIENTVSDKLRRDMPHELTHLIFHQGLTASLVPVWFDEGLAVYNQLYHEPSMFQSFQDALTNHSLLRLSDIASAFPQNSDQAELAYAQSWQLIDYMYSAFGQQTMKALLERMHNSPATFEQDIEQVLNTDIVHLENQWRLSLKQPAIPLPAQQLNTGPFSSMPGSNDPYAPWLIMLGILLIIGPIAGFSSLLIYQQHAQRRAQLLLVAPNTFSGNRTEYSQLINPLPYASFGQPGNFTSSAEFIFPEQKQVSSPYLPEDREEH